MTRLPITRGTPLTLIVNGEAIPAFSGETIATAMLAADHRTFRTDSRGQPRGMFCNMGTCGECTVTIADRRVRACLTEARDGMEVTTDG